MTEVQSALARALADVSELAPFALVGGLAVSVRAEPRLTRDVDLAVSVADDAAAEGVVIQLRRRGYGLRTVLEHRTGRMATARLTTPGDSGVLVDLLFFSSGVEPEIVAAAQVLTVAGDLVAPVATGAHLLAMKVLSEDERQRPNDRDDILALLREPETELAQARALLALISDRGLDRGRDLAARLASFVAEAGR